MLWSDNSNYSKLMPKTNVNLLKEKTLVSDATSYTVNLQQNGSESGCGSQITVMVGEYFSRP
jgi:hypothetical protein